MRQLARCVAVVVSLLGAAASAMAATPSDFYLNLLRRGVAAFDAEKYADASNHLRLAAFGLVDSIEHYETAHIYLALAYDQLQDADKARASARRVIAAERVERKYGSLALPAGVATSFDALARKLLNATELSALSRTQTSATARPQTDAAPKPQPAKPAPEPAVEKAPPAEKPPATQKIASATPTPAPKAPAPAPSVDIPSRLAAAERALNASQLAEARKIYRGLLDAQGITRESLLRVAEGLYRSRDFAATLLAFGKIGALQHGEEHLHYYLAVAFYETRRYKEAKESLTAALPHIELTPDVARYRDKIDAALN